MNKKKQAIIIFVLTVLFGAIAVRAVHAETVNNDPVVEWEDPYADIWSGATDADFRALEKVIFWEAANAECPLECEVAVVETILNRVLDPEWPDTIYGVCTDTRYGRQFCCWTIKHATGYQMELVSDSIAYVMERGPSELPNLKYTYFATKKQSAAKNHVWKGGKKGHGMWFGEKK